MLISVIYFLIGVVFLLVGASWFVEGVSSLSRRLGIPDIVAGLTVVALGTSAPELAVNVSAAFKGSTGMAVGNVIGSNILNILLILGITSLICPIHVTKTSQRVEIPLVVLSGFVVLVMGSDRWVDGVSASIITRSEGIVLLGFLLIFMAYINYVAHSKNETFPLAQSNILWKDFMRFFVGLAGLIFGSRFLVDGAVDIAQYMGISQTVIGLSIVALGTSTPELATSVVASWKGKSDIALGNVLGSNILNVFFILGLTAIIQPLPAEPALLRDFWVNISVSVLLLISTFTFRRMTIDRIEGVLYTAFYILYVIFLLF